jgi:peptidoglycan/xylan/chitin deacetylase (PgdA/CDA1 family)
VASTERLRADGGGDRLGGREWPYVLMYHSVATYRDDPYLITVRPHRFETQMRWLRRHGLRGVSMRELLAAERLGGTSGLVGLTFDDGYADFIQHVLPVLTRLDFTATVFVIAGRLGGTNSWDADAERKALMTAHQVRAAVDDGMEIGSHGLRHLPLPTLPPSRVAEETEASRAILQALTGQEVAGFCYPYGAVSPDVIGAVRAAGYDYGCGTTPAGLTCRHALPRTFVGDRDDAVRLRAKRYRHRRRVSHGSAAGRGRPDVPASVG